MRELQQALDLLQQEVWIDSGKLLGGALLRPEIQKSIEAVSAFAIVVSTLRSELTRSTM